MQGSYNRRQIRDRMNFNQRFFRFPATRQQQMKIQRLERINPMQQMLQEQIAPGSLRNQQQQNDNRLNQLRQQNQQLQQQIQQGVAQGQQLRQQGLVIARRNQQNLMRQQEMAADPDQADLIRRLRIEIAGQRGEIADQGMIREGIERELEITRRDMLGIERNFMMVRDQIADIEKERDDAIRELREKSESVQYGKREITDAQKEIQQIEDRLIDTRLQLDDMTRQRDARQIVEEPYEIAERLEPHQRLRSRSDADYIREETAHKEKQEAMKNIFDQMAEVSEEGQQQRLRADRAERTIKILDDEIAQLKEEGVSKKRMDHLQRQKEVAEQQLQRARDDATNARKEIEGLQENLELQRVAIKDLQETGIVKIEDKDEEIEEQFSEIQELKEQLANAQEEIENLKTIVRGQSGGKIDPQRQQQPMIEELKGKSAEERRSGADRARKRRAERRAQMEERRAQMEAQMEAQNLPPQVRSDVPMSEAEKQAIRELSTEELAKQIRKGRDPKQGGSQEDEKDDPQPEPEERVATPFIDWRSPGGDEKIKTSVDLAKKFMKDGGRVPGGVLMPEVKQLAKFYMISTKGKKKARLKGDLFEARMNQ
jgi:hypothetical protein